MINNVILGGAILFDGSMYLELNLKPWRGSRVWKLIKYIKRNKKELKRDKDQIIYFYHKETNKQLITEDIVHCKVFRLT